MLSLVRAGLAAALIATAAPLAAPAVGAVNTGSAAAGAGAPALAEMVDHLVTRHGKEPAGEGPRHIIGRAAGMHRDQRLLQQVLDRLVVLVLAVGLRRQACEGAGNRGGEGGYAGKH